MIIPSTIISTISTTYVVVPGCIVTLLYLIRKYRASKWGVCRANHSLQGKVFIVTGANSGIGKETVKGLIRRKARVIMACRNMDLARATVEEMRRSISSGELIPMHLDLASLASVRSFAAEVKTNFPNINVLINNAGIYTRNITRTEDGFESQLQINHLGPFLLTNLLLDQLKNSAPSRVVMVGSTLHENGVIDFENLNAEKGWPPKDHRAGYKTSKLANMYFCQSLSKRTVGTDVSVFAVCPGLCYTNLFKDMKWYYYILALPVAFMYLRSAEQGCQTVLHCAISDDSQLESGLFYRDCKLWHSKHKFSAEIADKLWDYSAKAVSL